MERISYQELPNAFFEQLREIETYISSSGIEENILNLMRMRSSQINGCAYCLDMHYKEMRHLGESEIRLSVLSAWKETDLFTEKEKSILAYTEALTDLSLNTLESSINKLLDYYSKEEVAFISLTITQINTWNRLMKAFRFKAGYYKIE